MNRFSGPLMSAATAQALELPSLLRLVAELAASDLGRERVLGLEPARDEEELGVRRRRFEEAQPLLAERRLVPFFETPLLDLFRRLDGGRPPIQGVDLIRLATLLRASREAAERIRAAGDGTPELRLRADPLPDLQELEQKILAKLDRRGEVRDDASPRLVTLRGKIRGLRDRLYDELGSYVKENREALSEETIPLRGGRLVLMLQSGSRGRLAGLTHGRSATGKSFYFEPLGMVESNNTLQQSVDDEQGERRRILSRLIERAGSVRRELELHRDFLAELDLLQAAGRFAQRCSSRLPNMCRRGSLKLVEARHPLLDPALLELREAALGQPGHAGEITPLTVEFIPGECALVVTGPNAGGKTVALKTVGLLVLAAHCGLPVPAAAGTAVPFLQTLVATVGDEQDLLADRSTFSGRLLRLKEAWEGAGPDSLVLLDELGSGTDPEEGAALSVTLLEGLVEKQALTVVTTHLVELAAAALELPGASCASMELDGETAEPTFRLVPGPPGGSEALGLARRLGLPAAWLDRAEERLGLEHRDLRRLLSEVEKIRQELAETKLRVETEESDAAKLRERLERELSALVDERLRLAKNLRAELETFRLETGRKLRGEVERLRDEVAAGRRKGLAEKAAARLFAAAPEIEVPETAEDGGPPVAGDAVRHRTFGWEGRLEKLDGDRAEVSVRGKRVRCRAGELSRVAPRAGTGAGSGRVRSPRSSVAVEPEAAGVSSELNLIGRRVEPALQALDGYLDQALLSSREEVRIIHGHGTGRLRKAVRDHLRRHPAVAAQRPGKSSEGGDGATVARLK